MKILAVIDMQNDFIDGALGTAEAQAIVPRVIDKIKRFDGRVLATRDTHGEDYLDTEEGRKLPVVHCVRDTQGWQIHADIEALLTEQPIDKPTFGSLGLGQVLSAYQKYQEPIESITLIGVCTDICVISNALLLKAYMPEVPVIVDASCCAGVTPETHRQALEAMKVCQINIVNE